MSQIAGVGARRFGQVPALNLRVRDGGKRKVLAWRLCWALLAAAFVFSTARHVLTGFRGHFERTGEVFHTTDVYLQALTDVPNCSEKFIALAAAVPTQKPILILVRSGSLEGSLTGMIISYLAWPRATQLITISGPDCAAELARVAPDSVSAIAFCEVRPPEWIHGAVPLGPKTSLVVLQRKVAAR